MKFFISFLLISLSCFASGKTPNILLICVDDLRPELGYCGVDYIHSPNIDALALEGRPFTRHYVQAPTCGASRYAMLTGTYGPTRNDALFDRAKKITKTSKKVSPSIPHWFRKYGYQTISIGKVSHHPGGLGGKDWNDNTRLEMPLSWNKTLMPTTLWKHPRGAMHGLANGEIRSEEKTLDVYQSFKGADTSYPDGLITETALLELDQLTNSNKPFFLAVGLIKPHLPFGAPAKYMNYYHNANIPKTTPQKPQGRTTWHNSREFKRYNHWGKDPNKNPEFALEVRRHYAACVSYVDAQVGKILSHLKQLNLDDNTIVILWSDHGWHLGEHAIWGKHSLFEESLLAPLIIKLPKTPDSGTPTNTITETIDLFPTLCELANLPLPKKLNGKSLVSHINKPKTVSSSAVSYYNNKVTIRTDHHRLIVHSDGYVELYDHTSPNKETKNIAINHPELVLQLAKMLYEKSPSKLPKSLIQKVAKKYK